MGRVTSNTHEVLNIWTELSEWAQDAMSAAVAVKLASGHTEFFHVEKFVFTEGYHVEQRLMQALCAKYGQIYSMPVGATVIFVARWSPCIECTTQSIPNFLRDARIVERRIRVKFRFEQYYARDSFARTHQVSDRHLWASSGVAAAAYQELSTAYGSYSFQEIARDEAAGSFTTKAKPFVVIEPTTVQRTSAIETWTIADLNE